MTMRNQNNNESNCENSSNINDGTRILLDGNGCPIVPLHTVDDSNLVRKLLRTVLIYILFSLVGPILVLVSLVITKKIRVSDLREIYQSVTAASKTTTNSSSSSSSSSSVAARNKVHDYQDPRLLAQLWKLPSAKPYVQHQALEYQRREGYCSLATLRCILYSFPTFPRTPKHLVPDQTSSGAGPSTPLQFQHTIETILREATNTGNTKNHTTTNNDTITIQTEIVGMSDNNQNEKKKEGDFSYAQFLKTLRDSFKDDADDDPQHCRRVAINYLRPVLFGFKPPKWVPCHLILGLLGGHFSPLLGLLDNPTDMNNANAKTGDNPLVGVFDVNHAYGGAYLIPAKLLYQAVKAKDISTGKSRAIIVVTLHHTTPQTTANRSA